MKKYIKKLISYSIASVLCILAVFTLSGCSSIDLSNLSELGSKNKEYSEDVFAMDTYMTVKAYGKNREAAVSRAIARIKTLDSMLSTGNADSEISQLNQNKNATVSEDSLALINQAIEISKNTDGAFNPMVLPLMRAWGFTDEDYKVPDDSTLNTLLQHIDINTVTVSSDGTVTLSDSEAEIDLGGIAKGYTSDSIMNIFKEEGVTSGIVSLGGNIQALGLKPDGSKWKIGIKNPDNTDEVLGTLEIDDKAVITSGGYERYFEEDGVTYHHILDTSDGYPAKSGLKSVTIVSDDGTLADGLSTSLYVMGLDKATEFYQSGIYDFDMILETDDNMIYVTEGIYDDFSSEYDYTEIK